MFPKSIAHNAAIKLMSTNQIISKVWSFCNELSNNGTIYSMPFIFVFNQIVTYAIRQKH
jgi:hypothetical protein